MVEDRSHKHRNKPNRMGDADKILLRKRALIETVNDELKNIAQIEHSRHRSFNNFIANSLSAIAAYCFFEKKLAIDFCQGRTTYYVLNYIEFTLIYFWHICVGIGFSNFS